MGFPLRWGCRVHSIMAETTAGEMCGYCGALDWTIAYFGCAVHKEACPARTTEYHQGDPPKEPYGEKEDYDA